MVGITELSALMTSLKGAKDLAESMIGLRDTAAFQGKIIEFQNLVMDAQQRVFAAQEERSALIEEVGELKKQIMRLEDWAAEKQRYVMKGVGYGGSVIVYELKPGMENGEPPHSICANCYQGGEKSILQPETRFPGRTQVSVCHRCGSEIITAGGRDLNLDKPRQTRTERGPRGPSR